MAQVTGRIKIKVNGVLLETKSGSKAQVSNTEREMIEGDNSVAGYSEKTSVPFVEGTLIHTDATALEDIDNFVDGSVTFEADTGQTWILRGATRTTPLELTGGEGEVPVRFEGISIEKV